MAYLGDYHTHTIYSHGRGTVEENVLAALKCGFKEIAITDHGFKHMMYNVRRMDWPFIIKDVQRMKEKYPMIKILLGLETNFNSLRGNIDITPADMRYMDIVVCGYHKFIKPDRFRDVFGLYVPNLVLDFFNMVSKKQMVKNTDAYIKAIEKNEIDIISHINYTAKVDVLEVAKAAAHFGTYLEINNKNINAKTLMASCRDEVFQKILGETDVKFIVDSDAHKVESVGDFSRADKLIERVGIPYERIMNWNNIPVFRSRITKHLINSGGKIKANELLSGNKIGAGESPDGD